MNLIEKLPCDIWLTILDYGCLEEALKVQELSETFERACCLAVRKRMTNLRYRLCQGVMQVQRKLKESPASFDNFRMTVFKTVVFLRYLITEVNLLFSTVWNYSEHVKGWLFLCPHLLPVITEFDDLYKSTMNLDVRREDLSSFNTRMLLKNYYAFLSKYDSELAERLTNIAGMRNFEVEALDVLLSCPSINFQLFLCCVVGDSRTYDISSYFGFYNLKPVFQVPDIHNSNLTTEMKKTTILRYLRECVQWENLTFLQSIITDVSDLEIRVGLGSTNDDMRFHLIMKLADKYRDIQDSPYPVLYRNIYLSQDGTKKMLNENYYRYASCNANMTGVCVFIKTSKQAQENLPLVIHRLRGQLKPVLEEKIQDCDGEGPSLLQERSLHKQPDQTYQHSFQLCIHYREGFNSCPAEHIIDVAYDLQNQCHITSHYIESEPFKEYINSTDSDEDS